LYALDVASLDELDAGSMLGPAQAAFEAHAIDSTSLTGEFTPP
jgi:hypothetical protein